MKIGYICKRFRPDVLSIIAHANEIISEYVEQGLRLTLRQLYYQFVSRALLPNKQSEYKRLGSIIGDARLAGLLDWDAIEDRTRGLHRLSAWGSPSEIISAVASQYRRDLWEGQEFRPEVFVEKEALSGVFAAICDKLRIGMLACKGYASLSELWECGAVRFAGYLEKEQTPVVLHFGDHDASGIDMTRDLRERLSMFAQQSVIVERIALNMDQVEKYDPPPNPAKMTDPRAQGYIAQYGNSSWELDALDPKVLRKLVETRVAKYRDDKLFNKMLATENEERETLATMSDRFDDIQKWLADG